MLLVLERTVSMRRFFGAPKTFVYTEVSDNIHNFTLKTFLILLLSADFFNIYFFKNFFSVKRSESR